MQASDIPTESGNINVDRLKVSTDRQDFVVSWDQSDLLRTDTVVMKITGKETVPELDGTSDITRPQQKMERASRSEQIWQAHVSFCEQGCILTKSMNSYEVKVEGIANDGRKVSKSAKFDLDIPITELNKVIEQNKCPAQKPTSKEIANLIALLAAMICTGIAIARAQAAATRPENHRLFVSLILFALNWAIYLPFYALQNDASAEIADVRSFLASCSGVLLLFAGGALHREAIERKNQGKNMSRFDDVALVCLGLLAVPHVVAFSPKFVFLEHAFINLLDVIVAFCGFGSVLLGFGMLTPDNYEGPWLEWVWATFKGGDPTKEGDLQKSWWKRARGVFRGGRANTWRWRILLFIVVAYFVFDAIYELPLLCQNLFNPKTIDPMAPWLMYTFAGLKLVFSFTFFAMINVNLRNEAKP
jgi:hypothetical protein